MSAIRESCACGAELEVTDRNSSVYSGLTERATEFRAAHEVCRERPPAPPAVAVGPSATGANPLPLPSFWHAYDDTDDALAVLTRMACPAPCVGVVNDTGWHAECERKARSALAILRAGHYPDDEPPADDTRSTAQQRTDGET